MQMKLSIILSLEIPSYFILNCLVQLVTYKVPFVAYGGD